MPGDLFSMVKKVRIESDTGRDGIFNLLKIQESIPRNRFRQRSTAGRARICKRLRSPGIDSPAYVS
jgi:hypothetical protein